VGTLKN